MNARRCFLSLGALLVSALVFLAGPASGAPDPSGVREIIVHADQPAGRIRSLLGVNRGPFAWPREPSGTTTNLVESYRRFGIDFIRTHDFYGPTDWHVIFPRWDADPADAANYDFRSSDERILAIVENGFGCFYRLGTSWKGRRLEPINDPPGTKRDASGRVTHVADRDDFKKWAAICAQTVRHYTEGWNNGSEFPIEYWEIWNEPDLAAQFWTGTPEQYYALYEEAARAIKAVNPKLKVGGPACTGGLREAYVEGFIRYCAERQVPLNFFSWHSYGGRDEFNPYQFRRDAERIRRALDAAGFTQAENIVTEWNAGIQQRLFSEAPAGAAFYASTLACLLDAGVDRAFQYCGDRHPGLGLHELRTGEPKICTFALAAWKRLLETPQRLAAIGSDQRGYNVVAGRSADGHRVQVLISDFQSSDHAFRLRVEKLPWAADAKVAIRRWLLDADHRFTLVEETSASGNEITLERPFRSESVCLIELQTVTNEAAPSGAAEPRENDTGEKAWLAHGLTATQRESLREPFRWGIENKFIPGGALLVIHRGEPVFRESFGLADLETKRPFTVDAPCRIASVTKPHTATLLALFVDQGKLSWDDPVDKYLPQFAQVAVRGKGLASRPPKIRELLSHTAGFPGNDERRASGPGFRTDGTLAEAVDDIARAGLATEPGSGFVYTGLGYMVAGRVAEVITGQEFGALMRERLLTPMGATTAMFHSAASEELKSRMPTMYERIGGQLGKADLSTRGEANVRFPTPGGGLISTLDDVARVMLLHRNQGVVGGKRLIAPESLQAQYRAQPATGRLGYGLGFNVLRTDEKGMGTRLRHTGASGTLALLDFEQDLLVVVLTQVPTKQTQPFHNRLMQAIGSVFSNR